MLFVAVFQLIFINESSELVLTTI